MPDEPSFLTSAQLAKDLQVCEESVRRLLVAGSLPGMKIAGQWRTPRVQWIAYQEGRWQPEPKQSVSLIARRSQAR